MWLKCVQRINHNTRGYFYHRAFLPLLHRYGLRQTCRIRQFGCVPKLTGIWPQSELFSNQIARVTSSQQCVLAILQVQHNRYHTLTSRSSNTKKTSFHGNQMVHSSHQDKGQLVYELGKLRYRQLQFMSVFTYGMAAYFLYLAPDIVLSALEHDIFSFETATNLTCLFISGISLPCLIQYVRRQLVLKLYFHAVDESYTIVTQKATLRQRIGNFKMTDIKKISFGKNNIVRTKFRVNNKSYFVYPFYFKVPADYNHMFGFTSAKK